MDDESASDEQSGSTKPFKITNQARDVRKGIVAGSLEELIAKINEKLVSGPVTVVLEADGTEIDDEEYFATLESHTNLMALTPGERWRPPAPPCRLSADQLDNAKGGYELAGIVGKLKHNICHVSLLGAADLELLSDMDPDSIEDITYPDRLFLEQLKEASGRYLSEKRQAQDALELLRLYQENETTTANGDHGRQDE